MNLEAKRREVEDILLLVRRRGLGVEAAKAQLASLGVMLVDEDAEMPEPFSPTPEELRELEVDDPQMFSAFTHLGKNMTGLLRLMELFTSKRIKDAGYQKAYPLQEER